MCGSRYGRISSPIDVDMCTTFCCLKSTRCTTSKHPNSETNQSMPQDPRTGSDTNNVVGTEFSSSISTHNAACAQNNSQWDKIFGCKCSDKRQKMQYLRPSTIFKDYKTSSRHSSNLSLNRFHHRN